MSDTHKTKRKFEKENLDGSEICVSDDSFESNPFGPINQSLKIDPKKKMKTRVSRLS